MTPAKVTCPQCQATLKLPPGMPAGARPKCPRCGTPVSVAGNSASAIAAGSANGSASKSTAVIHGSATVWRTAAVPAPTVMADALVPENRGVNLFIALGIIFGGGLLVLALTAGLLFICLSGDNTTRQNATGIGPEEDDVGQLPGGGKKQAAGKQKVLPTKALIVLSPEQELKVDKAAKRGIDYLKARQLKDGPEKGTWPGPHTVGYASLAGLTLLESNVPAKDPAIQNAAQYVRQRIQKDVAAFQVRPQGAQYETYQISIAILFLSRLDEPTDRPLIRSLALRLVASQYASGGWSYDSAPLTTNQEIELTSMLKDFPAHAGQGAKGSLASCRLGAFQRAFENNPLFYQEGGDNSNTQFALLALWTARRFDLKDLDPALKLVATRFRQSQQANGSWNYMAQSTVSKYPTMTAAGLLGLAVGYGLDENGKGAERMAKDQVLQRGIKALAQKVGGPTDDPAAPMEMYFLWSVERVAVLYQLAKIDGKDWYHWGVEFLLAKQLGDGKWFLAAGHGTSDVVDTRFALLFLQRANLAKDLTDKIQALAAVLGMQREE